MNREELYDALQEDKAQLDDGFIFVTEGIDVILTAIEEEQPLPHEEIEHLRHSIQETQTWLSELARHLPPMTVVQD